MCDRAEKSGWCCIPGGLENSLPSGEYYRNPSQAVFDLLWLFRVTLSWKWLVLLEIRYVLGLAGVGVAFIVWLLGGY